jgi:hypothetical protein
MSLPLRFPAETVRHGAASDVTATTAAGLMMPQVIGGR